MSVKLSDIIAEVQKEVSEHYDNKQAKKIMADIDAIHNELHGMGITGKIFGSFTPDELTRMAGQLSVLRAALMPYASYVHQSLKEARRLLDVREGGVRSSVKNDLYVKAAAAKQKAPSNEDIKSEVQRQLVRTIYTVDLHEIEFEKIQKYWYQIPLTCETIDRRVRELRGDRNTAKFNDMATEPLISAAPSQGGVSVTDQALAPSEGQS